MNKIDEERFELVLELLIGGCSLRNTAKLAGVNRGTALRYSKMLKEADDEFEATEQPTPAPLPQDGRTPPHLTQQRDTKEKT